MSQVVSAHTCSLRRLCIPLRDHDDRQDSSRACRHPWLRAPRAHIFRHSVATELLKAGTTLPEIGQLLRHKSQDTTRFYAKVDIDGLRTLSQLWPGGAQ